MNSWKELVWFNTDSTKKEWRECFLTICSNVNLLMESKIVDTQQPIKCILFMSSFKKIHFAKHLDTKWTASVKRYWNKFTLAWLTATIFNHSFQSRKIESMAPEGMAPSSSSPFIRGARIIFSLSYYLKINILPHFCVCFLYTVSCLKPSTNSSVKKPKISNRPFWPGYYFQVSKWTKTELTLER